ncbi:DNA-binding domain-containing protein [Photobacterium sp. CCB-ST2H9]|uniref:HvfC/BufC N-terminal domain-containing protein n=1 Tax=Photobacterium sp. CCB-ST2H9 TaxID=2912855 RepID=UPI002004141F|nr:DNA-binding domain-containing protein [Photobacterium sp. CCB-ST2H9]UTM57239.1 DNA-binding domain-containing protein [Photobacterium sp. CCB-ST2H9]
MNAVKPDGPDLATLQTSFARALHYQPSEITDHITPHALRAEQQLQIYRNNFIISLTEVLEATYPAVKAVVGEACFSALVRQHILTVPLEQGDVSHYGCGLENTIAAQEALHQSVPYLADLARLEWLVDRAAQLTPSGQDFPLEKLQDLTEARLAQARLVPNSGCGLLDSDYAVAQLWQAIRDDDLDTLERLDIRQPQSAIVLSGPRVITTTAAGTALVELTRQHRPLSQATPEMLALLGELISQQVFINIRYPDDTEASN